MASFSTNMQPAETRKVAIFGSSLIGSQWAMLYTSAGFRVALYDAQEDQAAGCLAKISKQLKELSAAGQLRGSLSADQQAQLVSAPESLEAALNGAFLVQECVYEDAQVKSDVFKVLDAKAPSDAILCSSSSCIMPSVFSSQLAGRSRCLVAHPLNPPYFLPLVELVPSPFTDPAVVKTVKETLSAIGQEPIVINSEIDGFAVNRLQYAMMNEAWRLVASGAISAEDVDKVVTCGLAPRYCFLGPLAVMQTNADGIRDFCARYGSSVVRVSATFGPTPAYSGDEVELVASQMDAAVPVESLAEVRAKRNDFLSALAHMKKNFQESRLS